MRKLQKTKTDTSGGNYYLLECPNCFELYEKRVDHIKTFTCDCTPKPITQKLIRYRNKSILNAPERTILIKGSNESNFRKLLKSFGEFNIILNEDIHQTPKGVRLEGRVHGSYRFKQLNANLCAV